MEHKSRDLPNSDDNLIHDNPPYREESININFAHMDIFRKEMSNLEPTSLRKHNDVTRLQTKIAKNISILKPGRMDLSGIAGTEDKSIDYSRRKSNSVDPKTEQSSAT